MYYIHAEAISTKPPTVMAIPAQHLRDITSAQAYRGLAVNGTDSKSDRMWLLCVDPPVSPNRKLRITKLQHDEFTTFPYPFNRQETAAACSGVFCRRWSRRRARKSGHHVAYLNPMRAAPHLTRLGALYTQKQGQHRTFRVSWPSSAVLSACC